MKIFPILFSLIALGLAIKTWQRPSYAEGFEDCQTQVGEDLDEALQEMLQQIFKDSETEEPTAQEPI